MIFLQKACQLVNDFTLKIFHRIPLPVYPYRMFMHRYQCIFIHIPKNAGSSILQSLGHKGGRDHVEWRHYSGSNIRWFTKYHKFAICRHPVERLFSAYQYTITGGNKSASDLILQKHIVGKTNNFEEFVTNILNENFLHENILFKPQYLFIYDYAGQCQVNDILRFESLDRDWEILAKKMNYPYKLKKINTMNKNVTYPMPALSDLLKQKIHYLYQKDFELFNYKLDENN